MTSNMANLNVENVNLQDENKNTFLHKSVLNNQLEEVKYLLTRGADASLVNSSGNTPLHEAVLKNYHQIVEAILKYSDRDKVKRFIDAKTLINDNTALHIAAGNGSYECASCLLSYGATFQVENNNGSLPIDLAAEYEVRRLLVNVELDSRLAAEGKFKTLESRMQQYSQADLAALAYARNDKHLTSLQMAALNNHCNTVRAIVNAMVERLHGRRYKINSSEMLQKITEFIGYGKKCAEHSPSLMVHSQDVTLINGELMAEEITEILSAAYNIIKVAEKIFKPNNGEPFEMPVILTIIDEMLEILQFKPEYSNYNDEIVRERNKARYVKMLYINEDDQSEYEAKIMSYMGILQIAISRNVAVFMSKIYTAKMIEAAKNNDLVMFKQFIEEPYINVNCYLHDTDARTSLHYAAENGNEEMVSQLLKKMADVSYFTDSNAETALYLAAKNGYLEIMRMLLQKRGFNNIADLQTTQEGWTPLHIAAMSGRVDMLKLLLANGATYDLKDKSGKRPVDLSGNMLVNEFFRGLDDLFEMAANGNVNLVRKLKALEDDELLAVGNAHNSSKHSLATIAEMNGHRKMASQILKMVEDATPVPMIQSETEFDFDEHYRGAESIRLIETLRTSRT